MDIKSESKQYTVPGYSEKAYSDRDRREKKHVKEQ